VEAPCDLVDAPGTTASREGAGDYLESVLYLDNSFTTKEITDSG